MDKSWIDRGDYWEFLLENYMLKKGRLGASNFLNATGEGFISCDQLNEQLRGAKFPISEEAKGRMARGVEREPIARLWYKTHWNSTMTVKQIGYVTPKWDNRIGALVDDIAGEEGLVEYKCPDIFYDDVKPIYMAQIQGEMAILGRKWCDYVVFCIPESKFYVKRILFDKDYWDKLYSQIVAFFEKYGSVYLK